MEILIIGGAVVLIMVFISTQIKKSAARAFEPETIDTTEFRIVKPRGFLHPLRENSEYLFEAYSKEYGDREERNFWKAQIYLTDAAENSAGKASEQIERDAAQVVSKESSQTADHETIFLLETEQIQDETEFCDFWKIVESRRWQKIFKLQIRVLKTYRADFLEKVDEITNSFQLK